MEEIQRDRKGTQIYTGDKDTERKIERASMRRDGGGVTDKVSFLLTVSLSPLSHYLYLS